MGVCQVSLGIECGVEEVEFSIRRDMTAAVKALVLLPTRKSVDGVTTVAG